MTISDRALIGIAAGTALVLTALGLATQAQRPERQQEVIIPGLGVHLRGGWKLLFYESCHYAVPATWQPTPDHSQVLAPEGDSVSVWMLPVLNWSLQKARLKAAFDPDGRVREDTVSRLWIESRDRGRLRQYIAVTNGSNACAIEVALPAAMPKAEETITAIAESVGFAPPGWTHALQ